MLIIKNEFSENIIFVLPTGRCFKVVFYTNILEEYYMPECYQNENLKTVAKSLGSVIMEDCSNLPELH